MWFRDTLANLVSGLGTAKDKTTGNFHHFTPRSQAEIQAAYRGNWIARKIVDVPAFDMLREWRDWQADDEQRTLIEAAEKALGLQAKYLDAVKRARRDGGSAILIGDGAPDPSQPLIPDSIGQGGIRYLTVLGRGQITPGVIDRDPTSDWFGQPAYYTLASAAKGVQQIHPSRVIRLLGAPVLDVLQAGGNEGWGDSVLEAVMDAVDQATSSAAYVNAMLPEAKQDVISVPGLSNYLSTAEGTSALTERFAYAARMKSMFGMLLLEGDGKSPEGEVFEQKQISFAGLPDVVRLYLSIAAGAADIPATRLLGKSPDGQNATGDSDTRNYYDRVAAEQKVEFSPRIAPLDELLIRHALGSRPPEVWYQWNPLYQSSQAEKATTLKTMADAIVAINGTGLVPPEVLADGTKGVLTDSGLLPGIDAAYDEHGDAPLTEGDTNADQYDASGNPAEGFTGIQGEDPTNVVPFPGQRASVGDAAPRTLYVSRKLTNAADVLSWAKDAGIPNLMPADSLHVTIAYSRQPVDWMKAGATWQGAELKIDAGGPRLLERFGDALVLLFASDALQYRHHEIGEAGASWDHPEYQPHVTLSWNAPDVDVNALAAYNGPLVFGPEIFEPVNEDWRATITGDAALPLPAPEDDQDDTADDLDGEDEATEEEVDAVDYDELEALFGAEMLASAGIRRPTQDAAPGWLGGFLDKARRGAHAAMGRKPFSEGSVSRDPAGRFAPKGAGGEQGAPRQTVGAQRLAESGVGADHGIVVNSARVRKYRGHDTVESFVAAHPKGRAHALRILAADHKAGRISFAEAQKSAPKSEPARVQAEDPIAALEKALAASKPTAAAPKPKATTPAPEPVAPKPSADPYDQPPTPRESRVLQAVRQANADARFPLVGLQEIRKRLPDLTRAEVDKAMIALNGKGLVSLQANADPKDRRFPVHEGTDFGGGRKDLIGITSRGTEHIRSAHKAGTHK